MRNAIRFDDRITVGAVPTSEELEQLDELGYRRLVDLRSDAERFGGHVGRKAAELGFDYFIIPVSRDDISLDDAKRFYEVVFEPGSAPVYAFARAARRPLALLVVFGVVARRERAALVFQEMARFGMPINGDILLHGFLVNQVRTGALASIVESILERRPELVARLRPH